MFKTLLPALCILASCLLNPVHAWAGKAFPTAPKSYVYDETGALETTHASLTALLAKEDQQFGNQILIAVFRSLEGEDHVDYTNRLFKYWNPGQKGKNNGVLIATYLTEKKIRIEVGYGLEPHLTDALSKRIINEILGPSFRQNRFGEGLYAASNQIIKIIHQGSMDPRPKSKPGLPIALVLVLLIGIPLMFIAIIASLSHRNSTISSHGIRNYRGNWGSGSSTMTDRSSSGWGSGSGGGFFGDGGGFGGGGGFFGGGGSSGGGGASGGW